MVTVNGVPDVPEEADTEHPVTVNVNEGAPASAKLTLMVTWTEAAWTGKEGKANRTASKPTVASKNPPLRRCKRPGRLTYLSQGAI